jgi:MFS family permease
MGRAMAVVGVPMLLAPALGPVLGGALLDGASWRLIFFVNLPVAVAALAPVVLRESRALAGHRHFDLAGAVTVTGGLMLLVYALTRATSDGWGAPATLVLLGASAALVAAFLAIEARSPWPLLPLRIFASRTLSASNAIMAMVGAVSFAEFFLLTLYLQDVLHYRAVESGAAFVGFAGTVVVFSNLAQVIVGRLGVRASLTAGLVLSVASVAWITRLPIDGHYLEDMFPAFVLGGAGLARSFVPVTIASLAGVSPADAGVASGLVNTSRQIGGAIGIAAASAIAEAVTRHSAATGAAAVDDGLRVALYALTGVLVVAAAVAATLVRPAARPAADEAPAEARRLLEAA